MKKKAVWPIVSSLMVVSLVLPLIGSGACAPKVTEEKAVTPEKEEVVEEKKVVTQEEPQPTQEKVTQEKAPPSQETVTKQQPPPTQEVAPQTPAPKQEPAATKIAMSGFAFVPATVTVAVGTTITWTNNDSVAHTVSHLTSLFDSGSLAPGNTFSYSFNQNGAFDYYCKFHPSMTARVLVGEQTTAPPQQRPAPGGDTYYDY